ncbi:MAG: hypothetical protein M9934_02200 [Thermomicrobiales bacterium]|nr:hypothetical protein [Thermomicrobiales bacterium]MCO5227082.1 hypothetical protein [Thermomicrobiales bacterium]
MHPLNPYVRCGADGVWGSDKLEVTEWEDPSVRVVLSPLMQDRLGFQTPVLRWSRQKFMEVLKDHERDAHVISDLSNQLSGWIYLGRERVNPEMRRVILLGSDERWYSVTMGPLLGSNNVVTVTGSRRSGFLVNRLKGMVNIVARGGE